MASDRVFCWNKNVAVGERLYNDILGRCWYAFFKCFFFIFCRKEGREENIYVVHQKKYVFDTIFPWTSQFVQSALCYYNMHKHIQTDIHTYIYTILSFSLSCLSLSWVGCRLHKRLKLRWTKLMYVCVCDGLWLPLPHKLAIELVRGDGGNSSSSNSKAFCSISCFTNAARGGININTYTLILYIGLRLMLLLLLLLCINKRWSEI